MNEKPLVSVIIPTYNRGKILPRTIKNVLNQNFQSLEVIIVDDGSTDDTRKIVEEMQKNEKRIKYLYQKNMGPGIARFSGIRAANGKFIHFLDSDDLILPKFYEKMIKRLENTPEDVGFVYCKGVTADPKTLKIINASYRGPEGYLFELSLLGKTSFSGGAHNAIVKKYVFEKIKFDKIEGFSKTGEDIYISNKVLKNFKAVFLDEYLTVYFFHSDEEATTGKKCFKEHLQTHINALLKVLEIFKEDYEKHPKFLSDKYLKIGSYLIIGKKYKEGRRYIIKALLKNPFNFLALFFLFVSFLGSEIFFLLREAAKKIKYFIWWFNFYTKVYIKRKDEILQIEDFIRKSVTNKTSII